MTRSAFVLLILLAACTKPAPAKRYILNGEVLKLDPATQTATIKGEKIDGWMEAMTMEYPVKDKAEFAKLKPGDRITATVFVTDPNYYIGEIKLTTKPL